MRAIFVPKIPRNLSRVLKALLQQVANNSRPVLNLKNVICNEEADNKMSLVRTSLYLDMILADKQSMSLSEIQKCPGVCAS